MIVAGAYFDDRAFDLIVESAMTGAANEAHRTRRPFDPDRWILCLARRFVGETVPLLSVLCANPRPDTAQQIYSTLISLGAVAVHDT